MRLPGFKRPNGEPFELVYAVRSRRTGGLSIGVELSPNRACNYACVYCSTDGLKRGEGADIDLDRLALEFGEALDLAADPTVIEGLEPGDQFASIALSGAGEPTNSFHFREVAQVVADSLAAKPAAREPRLVLLTNGSRISEKKVRAGLAALGDSNLEIWFKLDSATREGQARVNGSDLLLRQMRNNLRVAVEHAPTWIQTCVFDFDGAAPSDEEREAWVGFLDNQMQSGLSFAGVQLYSLKDPSAHADAARVTRASNATLEAWAAPARELGLTVEVSSA